MEKYSLNFIGTGNAWPVLVSDEHPFYDTGSVKELSNAAYTLEARENGQLKKRILLDAGFGVIPYLLQNENRLPEAVILTHAHLDHTVSLDWITHSFYKKHNKKKKLPLYSSVPAFKTVISSFPQLEDKIDFRPLFPGVIEKIEEMDKLSVTFYPVYHGNPAVGAGMIRLDIHGDKKILFTGDVLCPVLRKQDRESLKKIPVLITDSNNRFPYPGSNHWSFLPGFPGEEKRNSYLKDFLNKFGPSQVLSTHLHPFSDPRILKYFDQWLEEYRNEKLILSIKDFCAEILPVKTYLVHYGGGEDERYYNAPRMSREQLQEWVKQEGEMLTDYIVPAPGISVDLS